MSSKFYIYASGRWREVEMDTGCVSGWGLPNFVFVRGGRLVVAERTRVLSALRSLAAGRHSAAKDSYTLSKYVPPLSTTLKRWTKSPVHQHKIMVRPLNDQTCARCNDIRFNGLLKETNTVATQYSSTADASNQVTEIMISPPPQNTSNKNSFSPKRIMPPRGKNGKFSKSNCVNKSSLKNSQASQGRKHTIETSTVAVIHEEHAPRRFNKKMESFNIDREQLITTEIGEPREEIKELVIDEEVVAVLRRYLDKNNLGFNVKRFDKDEVYKEYVFYKINPMVVVEQCPRIKLMLERRQQNTGAASLQELLDGLGLQVVDKQMSQQRYRDRGEVSTSQSTKLRSTHSHARHNKENEFIQNILKNSQKQPDKLQKNSVLNKMKSNNVRSPLEKRTKMTRQTRTEEIESSGSSTNGSSNIYRQPNKAATRSPYEKKMKRMIRQKQTEEVVLGDSSTDSSSDNSSDGSTDSSIDGSSKNCRQPNKVAESPEASAVRTRSVTTTPSARLPRGGKPQTLTAAPAAAKRPTAAAPPAPVATTARAPAVNANQDILDARLQKNRGYSPSEDQTILSWVQKKDRMRLVNGNRVWRELESEYVAKTGVARSWHSLRNRYLRNILPALSGLVASPVAVQLRAAAAAGEIKNVKKPVANSILVMPSVRSAWAPHRARLASRSASQDIHSPTPTRTSTPRDHRSPQSHSREKTKISKRSSELKRKFRDLDSSQEERRALRPRSSDASRCSINPGDSTTRTLREKPKKRKLYNPQSMM